MVRAPAHFETVPCNEFIHTRMPATFPRRPVRPARQICWRWRCGWLLILLLVGLLSGATGLAVNYPLKVSSTNPRLLVDQNNAPFFLVGDAPHALVVNLTDADATRFLEDRRTNGFNSMWVEVLVEDSEAGRTNGSLLNGTTPFTNTLPGGLWDFTTPNEAYFAHMDTIVRIAATNGLMLLLNPLDTGGWTDSALANGTNRCRQYGQYLGNRYKNFSNILWFHGNDFQTWQNAADDAAVSAIAKGIRDVDTNHLQTVQLDYPVSSSVDSPNWASIVKLDSAYSYYAQYERVLREYQRTNIMPVVMIEGHYEYQTNYYGDFGTIPVLRRQMYWSMTSGAIGHCYGNDATWPFQAGWDAPAILNSPAVAQLRYCTALFQSRRWHALVPDTNHTVLTAGFGIYATNAVVSANNYATCARETNGHTVMVYVPTQRAMTINMAKISGTNALAWWFDPRTGTATNFGTFPTTGTNVFTPPDTNDWILVLDNAAKNFPAPGGLPLTLPLEVITNSLNATLIGTNYSTPLTASGGAAPYNWSLAPASLPLPGGISLSPGGLLIGTPTASGTFNFTARVTDADGVFADGSFVLLVNPAPLTVTAGSASRSYGATNPVLSGWVAGLLPGDSITANFTSAATTNSPIGVYPISVTLSAPGGILGNYIVTINGGNLTVTRAALLITAANADKIYGATFNPTNFSTTGLFNDDSVTNLTLASAGSVSNAPIGSYALTAGGASGPGLTNYIIGYSNATLTVGAANLLIAAGSTNKIYGATLNGLDYTAAGLLSGDSVTNVTLVSAGGVSNAPVGSYAINVSGATGAGLTNYTIGYSNGVLTVGAANLLITAGSTNKVYGATLNPVDYIVAGLLNGDSVTNVTLASSGSGSSAPMGNHPITAGAAQGVGLTNYTVGYSNGTLTVGLPQLFIAPTGTNEVELSWFALPPVFTLQGNADLTSTNWFSINDPVVLTAGGPEVALPATDGAFFYRLTAVTNAETGSLASPQLLIRSDGAAGIVLNWSGPAPYFILQTTTNLAATDWVTVTNPLRALLTGTNFVVLPATNDASYFRLKGY